MFLYNIINIKLISLAAFGNVSHEWKIQKNWFFFVIEKD